MQKSINKWTLLRITAFEKNKGEKVKCQKKNYFFLIFSSDEL